MLPGAEARNAAIEKAFTEGSLGDGTPVDSLSIQEQPEPTPLEGEAAGESWAQENDAAGQDADADASGQPGAEASEEPAAPSVDLDTEATEADHSSKRFRDRFNRQIEARKAAEGELSAYAAKTAKAEETISAMKNRLEALEAMVRQGDQPSSPASQSEPAAPVGGRSTKHWLDELLGSKDSFSQEDVRGVLESFGQQFDQRLESYDGRLREGEVVRETEKLGQEIRAVREKFPNVEEGWITDAIIASPDPENFNVEDFARSAQGFIDDISQRAIDGHGSESGAQDSTAAPDSPPRPSGTGGGAAASYQGAINPEDEPQGARTIRGRGALLRKHLADKFGAGVAGL